VTTITCGAAGYWSACTAGGSCGQGGLWQVTVDEGQLAEDFTGRTWQVTVAAAVKARAETRIVPSYITLLERSGVSPKLAQELARHSDIRLTMNVYTHAGLYDLAGAVNGLPSIFPPADAANASVGVLRATGTDDVQPAANVAKENNRTETGELTLGPNLGPCPALSGDFLRQAETDDSDMSQQKNPGNNAVFCTFPGDSLKLPGQDSNLDKENQNPNDTDRKPDTSQAHTESQTAGFVLRLRQETDEAFPATESPLASECAMSSAARRTAPPEPTPLFDLLD
jgi:hypothetical protein